MDSVAMDPAALDEVSGDASYSLLALFCSLHHIHTLAPSYTYWVQIDRDRRIDWVQQMNAKDEKKDDKPPVLWQLRYVLGNEGTIG